MKILNMIGATLTGASIAWLMILIPSTESYLWFAPYAQTEFTRDFNVYQYNNLQSGLMREEVIAKIGEPMACGIGFRLKPNMDYDGDNEQGKAVCECYSNDGGGFVPWDLGWVSMEVCYDHEGKVQKTVQEIYTD